MSVRRTIGRYELVSELGRGGMAVVYLGRQPDLDREVALKELATFYAGDPNFVQRFLRESRIAGSLSHPHIVTVYDFFEHEGALYIAMEYIARGSLRPLIDELTLAQAVGVLEGMLSALAYAGNRGIVHRDLKPENLLVTQEGSVKIADFGIAKVYDASMAAGPLLTATGMTVGTPHYMAPEQALGKEIGQPADLYSVGVIAYEMFVGRVPFDAPTAAGVLVQHLHEPVPPPRSFKPELSPALEDWLHSMLKKAPEERVQSAEAAWDALDEIVIDLLGSRWRRGARLSGTTSSGETSRPLTPAPFSEPRAETVSAGEGDGARGATVLAGAGPGAPATQLAGASAPPAGETSVESPELRARRHLPTPATPLVGRRAELEYVHALFRKEDARLATLTGPGGTGKTRLALQAAWELAERFPDGVYFVDLASVRDSEQVPTAIARVLDVREARGRPLPDRLKEHLLNRQLLLLLDNFEHVQEAAPFLGELLAEASGVKALVTSRSRLHLYGEHEYPVPPLTEEEALDLFAARARAVRPGFVLDGARTHVAELCRRLDRLPLAIELAAARSRRFSPEQLLGVLTHPLELATHGPVDVPARQQTLRATIEWSHSLLDEAERTLFARLSVFLGGCTLEAAEEVCSAQLETLAALVDNSLVRERVGPGGDLRFVMLETIREYAVEQLEESGEAEDMRQRHAEHFLTLVQGAEPNFFGPDQALWLKRLEIEHANLDTARTALTRAGQSELALELAAASWRFLYLGGRTSEGETWLEEALAETLAPTIPRVRALQGAGTLAINQGANERGREHIEEALALARKLDDRLGIATALSQLGGLSSQAGDHERALALHEESLLHSRQLGDTRMLSASIANFAITALYRGDYDRAVELLQESLALARSLESAGDVARMLAHLGIATFHQSRVDEASSLLAESLTLAHQGQFKVLTLWGLEGLAAVAATRGEGERAARLMGAGDSLAEAVAVPLTEIHFVRPIRERSVAAARGELGEEAFATAMAEGREMALEEALSYALAGSSAR